MRAGELRDVQSGLLEVLRNMRDGFGRWTELGAEFPGGEEFSKAGAAGRINRLQLRLDLIVLRNFSTTVTDICDWPPTYSRRRDRRPLFGMGSTGAADALPMTVAARAATTQM